MILPEGYATVCQHRRVGFAQTERIVYCANGGFLRIPDAVPYCMDCGLIILSSESSIYVSTGQ